MLRLPIIPVVGTGRTAFQPIWVEDIASCIVKSVETLQAMVSRLAGKLDHMNATMDANHRTLLALVENAAGEAAEETEDAVPPQKTDEPPEHVEEAAKGDEFDADGIPSSGAPF